MKNIISKIINKMKKRELIYIGLGVLFILITLIVAGVQLEDSILDHTTFAGDCGGEQFVRNLTDEVTIEQTFIVGHDFEYMELYCSNHDMYIQGDTIISIRNDASNEEVINERIPNGRITFGTPLRIELAGKVGEQYTIFIWAEGTTDDAIGFYGYMPQSENENTALVNGEKSGYVLDIGLKQSTKVYEYLTGIVLAVMIVGMLGLMYYMYKRKMEPHHVFLMIAIPLGLVFLCFFNVNFVNDGDTHFARVYHYSNVVLGIEDQDNGYYYATTMRADDLDVLNNSTSSVAWNAHNMYYILENWKWFAEDTSLVEGIEWRNAGVTNPLEYLPAIVIFVIGRIIGLGIYPMIVLAKIASFVCYIIAIYYAIKLTPVGKYLMVFAGALPLALTEAANLTYDTMIVMAAFLLVAMILKVHYEGVNKALLVGMMLCCIVLAVSKTAIYTPIALLMCFTNKEKWGRNSKKWKWIALLASVTIVVAVVQYGSIIKSVYKSEVDAVQVSESESAGASSAESVNHEKEHYGFLYVLREPIEFSKMCVNTVMHHIENPTMGMLGKRVPWGEDSLPKYSYFIFGIALILVKNGFGEERYRLGKTMRFGMLGITLLVYLGYLVSFLTITETKYNYVWGIQGRYFIPLLPLLLLTYRNNECVQKEDSGKVLCMGYYFSMMLYAICYLDVFLTVVN